MPCRAEGTNFHQIAALKKIWPKFSISSIYSFCPRRQVLISTCSVSQPQLLFIQVLSVRLVETSQASRVPPIETAQLNNFEVLEASCVHSTLDCQPSQLINL